MEKINRKIKWTSQHQAKEIAFGSATALQGSN